MNIDTDQLLEGIQIEHSGDPNDFPLWYKQFSELDEKKRKKFAELALKRVKAAKPEAYEFIQKFRCELVGISPNISYALIKDEGPDSLSVTWVHGFSMPTLLYWCKQGGFGFFVNANLDYNDTVLNRVEGNKVDPTIKGFTG